MRVLVIEILFIASSLPVWNPQFDLTDYVDLNSYILYAAAFWMVVFTGDILRVWWKGKPRKHRIKGFEPIDPGVPHGRFIQTGEQSFTVLLKCSVTPSGAAGESIGRVLGIGAGVVVILFLLHSDGWIEQSTVTRIALEIFAPIYALLYPLLALSPTKIEIHPSFVSVGGRRLAREHFGQFLPGPRLSYSYGDRIFTFGGFWQPNDAASIVTSLNDLYEGRRWLPRAAAHRAH